jgi:hypothetical protein
MGAILNVAARSGPLASGVRHRAHPKGARHALPGATRNLWLSIPSNILEFTLTNLHVTHSRCRRGHRTLVRAAAIGLTLLLAETAQANIINITGNLIWFGYKNHGDGSFNLTAQTQGALDASGTLVTAISGTFLGRTVEALSNFEGADNKLLSKPVDADPFSAKGLGLTFSPFSDGYYAGFPDNVVNLYHTASGLAADIGSDSAPSYSGIYSVRNVVVTDVSDVPEPQTLLLVGLSLFCLWTQRTGFSNALTVGVPAHVQRRRAALQKAA